MNIDVNLLHVTPLEILVGAIRQCYESNDRSDSTFNNGIWSCGSKDKELIKRITTDGHGSTLEHITFNFQIKGISRLNLQELARHRIASLSVKSTRYTLKELKNENSFIVNNEYDMKRILKYINIPEHIEQNIKVAAIDALENLRVAVKSGLSNDELKYLVPECYKLDLYWSINARSLQNFLNLRLSERAHFEIRELAEKVYKAIPEQYKFIFKV